MSVCEVSIFLLLVSEFWGWGIGYEVWLGWEKARNDEALVVRCERPRWRSSGVEIVHEVVDPTGRDLGL